MRVFLLSIATLLLQIQSSSSSLQCPIGWGGKSTTILQTIPPEWINDGYCDCPLSGIDEPDTEACSGAGSWSGAMLDPTAESSSSSSKTCPLQATLILPPSRIHDTICDCCDGSDEFPGVCIDDCERVLANERKAHEQMQIKFQNGYALRKETIASYETAKTEWKNELQQIENDIKEYQTKIDELDQISFKEKKWWAGERRRIMSEIGGRGDDVKHELGFLSSLTEEEINQFIVGACQLAGEKETDRDRNKEVNSMSFSSGEVTCLALRLGALDLGMYWDDETDEFRKMKFGEGVTEDDESLEEEAVAVLVDVILGEKVEESLGKDDKLKTLSPKENEKKRHDDYSPEDGDDDLPYDGDDDVMFDEFDSGDDEDGNKLDEVEKKKQEKIEQHAKERQKASDENDVNSEKIISVLSRETFKSEAKRLLDKINSILDSSPDDENGSSETDKPPLNLDPIVIQKTRFDLLALTDQVQNGERFTKSARSLLTKFFSSPEYSRQDLIHLAIATTYHSQITSAEVTHLLIAILPDLPSWPDTDATCSPQTRHKTPCTTPPTTQRNGITFPPEPYLTAAAQHHCQTLSHSDNTCASSPDEIPLILHGFAGYHTPVATRPFDDPISNHFIPLQDLQLKLTFHKLMQTTEDLRSQKRDLETKQTDITSKLQTDYGFNGELYKLRDTCHSMDANQYQYEVCFFGQASQRDRGRSKGGTNLGKWDRMKVDEETLEWVMYYENGLRCWNGPTRHVEVRVTCGEETKVLSAEEPETCSYLMRMESYFVCDEGFAKMRGLEIPE